MRRFCVTKIVNILRYVLGWSMIIFIYLEVRGFQSGTFFCRKIGDSGINLYF